MYQFKGLHQQQSVLMNLLPGTNTLPKNQICRIIIYCILFRISCITLQRFFDYASNAQFLIGFNQLQAITLDHNNLTSQTTFPLMPLIHTLSLAFNQIRTLEPFIVNLSWVRFRCSMDILLILVAVISKPYTIKFGGQ